MLRQFLLALFVLVGTGVSLGQGTGIVEGIPAACIQRAKIVEALAYLRTGDEGTLEYDPVVGRYYECTEAGGPYWVTAGHVRAAVVDLGGAYSDYLYGSASASGDCPVANRGPLIRIGAVPYEGYSGSVPYFCGEAYLNAQNNTVYRYAATWWDGYYGWAGFSTAETSNAGQFNARKQLVDDSIDDVLFAIEVAYDLTTYVDAGPQWYRNALNVALVPVLEDGRIMDDGWGNEGNEGAPGGDGGDGDGGGGGTDWQEGQHKTRCDGSGSLNIFEKALFFAFEPCEPWASTFLATSQEGSTKFPFGLSTWFALDFADIGALYYPNEYVLADLEPEEGSEYRSRGSFMITLPEFDLGVVVIQERTVSLLDNAVGRWWVDVGRLWLLWYFQAAFFIGVFMRFIR